MSDKQCPNCGGKLPGHKVNIAVGKQVVWADCFACGWYEGIEADLAHLPEWKNVRIAPDDE